MRTIIIIFLISGFVPDSIAQDLFNLGHYQLCTNCPGNPSDPNKTYTYGTKTAMKVNEIGDNYDRRNPGKGSLWRFVLLKPVTAKTTSSKINKL